MASSGANVVCISLSFVICNEESDGMQSFHEVAHMGSLDILSVEESDDFHAVSLPILKLQTLKPNMANPYKEVENIADLPAPDSTGYITRYVFQYIDFNLVPQYVAAGHRFTDCCFLGCEIPSAMEDEPQR